MESFYDFIFNWYNYSFVFYFFILIIFLKSNIINNIRIINKYRTFNLYSDVLIAVNIR